MTAIKSAPTLTLAGDEYEAEDGSRAIRCRNICRAVLEIAGGTRRTAAGHKVRHTPPEGVGVSRLRAAIRAVLKMPRLKDEANLGDLRAHGDALGGHGVKLETKRTSRGRYIPLTEENLRKCSTFLVTEHDAILW